MCDGGGGGSGSGDDDGEDTRTCVAVRRVATSVCVWNVM